MNINLTEDLIKLAIQEYLSRQLVQEIASTEITLTAGRAPNGLTASIDVCFTSYTKQTEEVLAVPAMVLTKVESIPAKTTVASKPAPKKVAAPAVKEDKTPEVVHKEIVKEIAEDLGTVDAFGASIEELPLAEEKVVEAPIVEDGNIMTTNFELKTAADNVAAPLTDDVEDLFNC